MSRAGLVRRADSFSQDPSTSEKNTKDQVCRDPGIVMPGSRITGLRFFHVIAFTGTARLAGPAISKHLTPL